MPVTTSIKKNIGESGYADVRPSKKGVRIMFDSGLGFDLEADQWEDGRQSGQYNITLDANNSKIVGVRPIAGTYILDFVGLGNRINELPEPKTQRGGPRQSKDGKKKWFQADSLAFVTVLSVLSEGKYQGLKIYHNVPYIFSPVPGSTGTQLQASGKNELERVETFLRAAGFDLVDQDIPFSGNVLPWLEQTLLGIHKPFMGVLAETGFLNSLSELPKELAAGYLKKLPKKGKK